MNSFDAILDMTILFFCRRPSSLPVRYAATVIAFGKKRLGRQIQRLGDNLLGTWIRFDQCLPDRLTADSSFSGNRGKTSIRKRQLVDDPGPSFCLVAEQLAGLGVNVHIDGEYSSIN